MTNSAFAWRKRYVSTLCAGLVVFAYVGVSAVRAAQISPLLYSNTGSTRAVALESVTGFGAKNEELERFDLRFYQGRWEDSH